jgi:hypothetical protein
MKIRFSLILSLAISLLIGSAPLLAHHGNAAYDASKSVTMKGTVTEWWWANPHCLLMYDVKADNGDVAHWITETQAPINMIPAGWSKDSFKAGDMVTITVEPAKSGKPIGRIETVVLPNGKTLIGQSQKTLLQKDASEGHQ